MKRLGMLKHIELMIGWSFVSLFHFLTECEEPSTVVLTKYLSMNN